MKIRNRRLIVSSIFAGIVVTASASAIAFNDSNPFDPAIRDVRVGERGLQTRIAIFCDKTCLPEAIGAGEFYLAGAGDAFALDLSSASKRISGLRAVTNRDGTNLNVSYSGTLEKTATKPCSVGGKTATCLDLFFVDAGAPSSSVARDVEPSSKQEAVLKDEVVAKVPAAPVLRESADERLAQFAKLSPPERLAPPEMPILAKVQPIEETVDVGTPTLRQTEPLARAVEAEYAERVETLLGKKLTPAYCNNASATLQTDAWALGAMVDMGLCAASRGDAVEAESILSRLLEYTPDNYEALVGRALIAEYAGEKGAALRYYQDALDAPPPVEESTRIVEAMAALAKG